MDRIKEFMREAVQLSHKGMLSNDGGPFGCLIVHGEEIIGRGWNRVIADTDPTAHAEIVAIRDACKKLGSFQLHDCEIYSSCEPCPMCMGAIYWSRPRVVYFANSRDDAAAIGFDDSFIYEQLKQPCDQRKITMISCKSEHALEIFEQWRLKENKILY